MSLKAAFTKEEAVLNEVWQEILKCCMCNERIAVVRMEKIEKDSFSGQMRAICCACLPKAVAEFTASKDAAAIAKAVDAIIEQKEAV